MTPTPDGFQILAQDVAPFIVLAYLLWDASKRAERVIMAAIELMRHCDCQNSDSTTPSSALSDSGASQALDGHAPE